MSELERTWDGAPVAREAPYASCVVVWRAAGSDRQVLILHRLAPGGPGFEGEWAWTPPSGARQPGETPGEAARRELREETGLEVPFEVAASPSPEVALFVAEAPPDSAVVLDAEHDAFLWLPLEEARARCLPAVVAACLEAAFPLS